jgi:hypothetical protein
VVSSYDTDSKPPDNPITNSPNDFIILRDPGAVVIQQDFAHFILDLLAAQKTNPDKGALEFLRTHNERLSKLKSTGQIQEKKLSKDRAVETLFPGLLKPNNLPANAFQRLGQCASDWHNLMVIHVLYGQLLTQFATTGDRRYFDQLISTIGKVQKIGLISNTPACKTW